MISAVLMSSTDVTRGRKNPLHFGLSQRLSDARKTHGLSQRQLTERAGVSLGVVAYIEREKERAPGPDTVEKLARALRLSACWLAYGAEGPLLFQPKRPQAEHPPEGPQVTTDAAEGPLLCEELPARLRAAREARGLSRKALGRDSGTSDTTVRQAEEGEMLPNVATVEKLAVALDVSPCWLSYGIGEGPE